MYVVQCTLLHQEDPNTLFFLLTTSVVVALFFFVKQKSEVSDSFEDYVNIMPTETGQPVHTLRADNGGEFIGHQFREWLSTNGIRLETSAPHSPEQNGVSERANRTIMEGPR